MEKGIATHFRYWDVDYDDKFPVCNIEEIKKELLAKLEKSVKSQLMGEVPVGVLLSGGLDSSAIAYFVKKCGANIKTFNIGFKNLNEFEYSSQVAKELGLEHMEILMSIDDVVSDFDRVMHALDEPIADPACIPLYMLGKELKKHVTVVLSGEGGDELFGGYNQYKYCLENDKKIPYQKFFEYFLEKSYYFKNTDHFLKNNNTRPISYRFKKYFEDQPLLNGMLAYDIKTWMPENLMMKADKILMAHSLEGRFPFLDMDLFQFSAKDVSQKYKISKNLETKWILKEAMEGLLPKDVIRRKKMGFSVPVSEILDKMKEKVSNTFKDAKMHPDLIRILNIDNIEKFSEEYYDGKKEHALQLWTFFVLIYWLVKVFPGYRQV